MKRLTLLATLFTFGFSRPDVPSAARVGTVNPDAFEAFGTVTEVIQPNQPGRVEYLATWWDGICPHNVVLHPGTRVQVIRLANSTTLVVEPITPAKPLTLVHPLQDAA